MDLLFTLFIFIMGCFFGHQLLAYRIYKKLHKMTEDEVKVAPHIKFLKLEQHNNVFYTYDVKSNDFMVQGKSLEEIASNLQLYKGINIALIAGPNEKIIAVKDGKVYNES